MLRDLDADFDADMPAGRLSIAQKHVVQIARALAHESRVLIFDEPTASLSQRECAELFRIVRKLRDAGCALLFISHKFDEIFELADRYAVFRDGVSVGAGNVSDVTSDELIRLMVGRPVEQLFPKLETDARRRAAARRGPEPRRRVRRHLVRVAPRRDLGVYGLVGAGRTELAQVLFGINARRLREHRARRADRGYRAGARRPADARAASCRSRSPRTSRCRISRRSRRAAGAAPRARRSSRAQWIDAARRSRRTGPEQPVHSLSGGNQQKVVIAKWLARKPGVLILDEPTKGIDVGAKAAVHAVTSEFARAGGGVLMISSDLPEILGMSDRVLVMRRGRVRGEFTRAQATSEKLLRAASDA